MKKTKNAVLIVLIVGIFTAGTLTVFTMKAADKYSLSTSNSPVFETNVSYTENKQDSTTTKTPIEENKVSNFPVNEQGQTYGPRIYDSTEEPDLISAESEDGGMGYIKKSDLDIPVKNPEEAIVQQNVLKKSGYRSIPLYKSDGKTIIGEFKLYYPNSD